MPQLDFTNPHQRFLRKFPQRSQSLRVKSTSSPTSPSETRSFSSSIKNGTSRVNQTPLTKLIITNHNLIIQDTLSSSFSLVDSSSSSLVKPSTIDDAGLTLSSLPLNTNLDKKSLVGYASIKKEDGDFQWPIINGDSSHKSSTLFINCLFSPSILNAATDQQLNLSHFDQNNYSNGQKKFTPNKDSSCGTVFEEGSVEDEGIITSACEDDILEESDDDDYLEDLDEDCGDRLNFNQMRQIHLVRHFQLGLGISIKGGSDYSLPVIIAGIRPGTPASNSDSIFVGDQLISVNGVPIDETTSHHDALRLLSECGDQVCIVVRHCNAVSTFRKHWRRRDLFGGSVDARHSTQNSMPDLIGSLHGNDSKSYDQHSSPSATTNFRRSNLSRSMTSLSHYLRIDLFQAGLSQYISYSDKLRDSSFEVFTSDGNALVIQCSNENICFKWCHAIKSTIDNLTDSFIRYFNKHFPQREHIFYMGWVSECLSNESQIPLKHSLGYRWLNRYLIMKGGNCYLFKAPPTATLHSFKQRIANISRRNQNGSSGSSLGSVGSSGSDASNSSSSTHALSTSNLINSANSYQLRKSKPDRLLRLNKELDNELSNRSLTYFTCYKSDFCCVKTNELPDEKKHCFVICNGTVRHKYYSTEDEFDLKKLQQSWARANYQSVIKLKNKTFSVVLEEENIFGSLTLDWRYGFSFYNPKTKQYLWSYKFYQLKNSSDDGTLRLHLTFVTDPNDSRVTKTHVLQCSCLQTLIYSIHAFLSAKVYSLHI